MATKIHTTEDHIITFTTGYSNAMFWPVFLFLFSVCLSVR